MLIQVLKSKLKDVIVTDANTEYEGSITLDPDLIDAANLHPYERVEVNAISGDARIVTYVIPGEQGSGCVELNGGAANFFKQGEHIHVNCFVFVEHEEYSAYYQDYMNSEHVCPKIVKTDITNKVIEDSNCIGNMAEESLD